MASLTAYNIDGHLMLTQKKIYFDHRFAGLKCIWKWVPIQSLETVEKIICPLLKIISATSDTAQHNRPIKTN